MRYLVYLIVALAGALPAAAQTAPGDKTPDGRSFELILPALEGDTLTCHDYHNRRVNFVEVEELGDAGRAQFIWGAGPVILTDPDLMRPLPTALRLFFELHECGHHALGHLLSPNGRSEREADCWAVAQGHRLGAFDRAAIGSWLPYFSPSRGDINGHLPGPKRVDFLLSCYDDAPGIMARLE